MKSTEYYGDIKDFLIIALFEHHLQRVPSWEYLAGLKERIEDAAFNAYEVDANFKASVDYMTARLMRITDLDYKD